MSSLLWLPVTLSATGAAAAAVTLTIPAPAAGLFNLLHFLEIVMYCTLARTGGVTPTVITTTNLPGSLAFTMESAQAVGTAIREVLSMVEPLKSSVAATATTIVCPATTSVIWRVNAIYSVG